MKISKQDWNKNFWFLQCFERARKKCKSKNEVKNKPIISPRCRLMLSLYNYYERKCDHDADDDEDSREN